MFTNHDEFWMQQALVVAAKAEKAGEVPVGAILVLDHEMIGAGFNSPIALHDPTAHAELVAIRQAATKIANYRLVNTTLYVTLEPCIMCAGAMVHARIKRIIYGATDPKAGAIVSKAQVLDQAYLNHRVEYAGGLLAEPCGHLLTGFFKDRRSKSDK